MNPAEASPPRALGQVIFFEIGLMPHIADLD
jgi:hypothetical protein